MYALLEHFFIVLLNTIVIPDVIMPVIFLHTNIWNFTDFKIKMVLPNILL